MLRKSFIALSTLLLGTLAAATASAEDFSVHASGGAAIPVGRPQPAKFRVGAGGNVKLLFPLFSPNLAVGPSVGVYQLEEQADHNQGATLWSFGATARLQGNRSASVLPYVDVSGSVDKQASLFRPGLATSLGVEFATDASRTFSLGPVVSFQHTFENTFKMSTDLLPHRDANVLLVGLSVSFDGAPKPVVHTNTVVKTETQVVQSVQIVPVPVSVEDDNEGAALLLPTSVKFDKDSAAVGDSSKAFLDDLALKINDPRGAGYMLVVEGYASSEGDTQRNLNLSWLRANSVTDYLANTGKVERARLHPVAFGPTGDPNDAANRRADVIVVRLVKVGTSK